jgi:hypothetical protein
VGIESHSGFHLFERMVVDAADLVGRKERMWCRIESGSELILSSIGTDRDISNSNQNRMRESLLPQYCNFKDWGFPERIHQREGKGLLNYYNL